MTAPGTPDPAAARVPPIPAHDPFGLSAEDEARAAALKVMQRRATGLLVFFAFVFLATRLLEARWHWLGAIRAMSEAAMVGGLADWFAVTALFREPLGLPIPHTAIVKTRKDRIGRSLGNFVQHNFLARAVIARQLAEMHVARRLATWAAVPENAARVARQLAAGVARAVEVLPDEEVRSTLHQSLVSRGRRTQVAPILGDVLLLVAADGRHQALLDRMLRLVDRLLEENKDVIRDRIAHESPWWVPTAIDERLYQKIVAGVERILAEVRADPRHPMRGQFDKILGEFVDNLKHSPEVIARAEQLKEELLQSPVVEELSGSIWENLRRTLVKYASPDTPNPEPLQRAIVTMAESALNNPALLAEIDQAVTNVALGVVEQHRSEVGSLIARTVSEWDADAATRKIEIQVGRDLQFIRINGTLVGGLVGLLLYFLSELIDRFPIVF